MTVYARSDVCYVSISRDHGGCGEGHARPVVYGAPAQVWELTCHGGCEDFLRHDQLWSVTPQTIPETFDETATREDAEKRSQLEHAANQGETNKLIALALAKLAEQGELNGSALQVLLSSLRPELAVEVQKGQPRRVIESSHSASPEPEDAAPADAPPVEREPVSDAPLPAPELEALSLADLKEIAVAKGLPTTRSKADQIAIILKAEQE